MDQKEAYLNKISDIFSEVLDRSNLPKSDFTNFPKGHIKPFCIVLNAFGFPFTGPMHTARPVGPDYYLDPVYFIYVGLFNAWVAGREKKFGPIPGKNPGAQEAAWRNQGLYIQAFDKIGLTVKDWDYVVETAYQYQ